jgi:hypothetical protein
MYPNAVQNEKCSTQTGTGGDTLFPRWPGVFRTFDTSIPVLPLLGYRHHQTM